MRVFLSENVKFAIKLEHRVRVLLTCFAWIIGHFDINDSFALLSNRVFTGCITALLQCMKTVR